MLPLNDFHSFYICGETITILQYFGLSGFFFHFGVHVMFLSFNGAAASQQLSYYKFDLLLNHIQSNVLICTFTFVQFFSFSNHLI